MRPVFFGHDLHELDIPSPALLFDWQIHDDRSWFEELFFFELFLEVQITDSASKFFFRLSERSTMTDVMRRAVAQV